MSSPDTLILNREPDKQVERLREIMRRLRAPDGCPWDREQTHESILPDLLEETYEFVDTVRSGDFPHMREELGDLLLQVVFHAQIAEEAGHFTFDEVARELSDKLVRRHPHVFGDAEAKDTEAVLTRWDQIKRQERGDEKKPYLHGTGVGLPAILRAVKLQKKAGKVDFDWPDSDAVIEKIREELEEVVETRHNREGQKRLEEELGDLLFAVSNLCRKEHINPEVALNAANEKFERRFGQVEKKLTENGIPLGQATLEQMDALWETIKKEEKTTPRA